MKTCPDCGKTLSFLRRLADRCPECQDVADEKQAQAQRLAAQEAETAQQERYALQQKCPVCGSTRYRTGCLPDSGGSALTGSNQARFRPEENWIEAHPLIALACLSCGYVRLFLSESDRAELDGQ
jgi:rRNA maturation protein Nop10